MSAIQTNAPQQTPVMQLQTANNVGVMDKVPQERLYQPGKYSIPPELLRVPRYEEKKSGGFFSFLGKLVFATAVTGIAAGLIRKYPLAKFDLNLEHKGFAKNVKYYTAKVGDFVNDKIFAKVKNLVKDLKKEEPKADTPKKVDDKK